MKIAYLRCDGAKEIIEGDVCHFCDEKGITYDTSNPYTPEQNSKVERYQGHLMEKTRTLMIESNLKNLEWPLAVRAAAYIINRLPTRANEDWMTLYKRYYTRKPDIWMCSVSAH
jgi:transposase InsO family protein